ncbi:hypothetical protein HMPREF1983_00248 [Gemella bergeri ATCC 700627]|uniref:Acyl-CoA thioester hydrolase, YbgC/YbaW family n=1 Tax=Gemella bergeri ATCC 700627 TaxID=1321820 RepID=U2SBK7_9BACL|nr:hypothetical protein [Gemella bergeri]ERK60147.1 hypothetical protein HMPREF1983_00248 [Gemella bergeri ATCC 700627]
MYEKIIKFKLEKKFFNKSGYLDNKYIYEWLNLAKKHFFSSLGINIDSLIEYDLYYADIEVKYSIRKNIKFENQDIFIKVWIDKHNGVKTIFSYEFLINEEVIILASSSHSILKINGERAIRIDRNLPKWDQILKDVVNNEK